MDKRILEVLACPVCKGKLIYGQESQELFCRFDKLAYPIRDGVHIMVVDNARQLVEDE